MQASNRRILAIIALVAVIGAASTVALGIQPASTRTNSSDALAVAPVGTRAAAPTRERARERGNPSVPTSVGLSGHVGEEFVVPADWSHARVKRELDAARELADTRERMVLRGEVLEAELDQAAADPRLRQQLLDRRDAAELRFQRAHARLTALEERLSELDG